MTQENKPILVLVTFPTAENAREIGTQLVEKQLVACVNLIPGAESIYRWQGKTETARETLAIIKTTTGNFPALTAEIESSHPYEVPEIIAIRPAEVSAPYLAWWMGG